MRALCLLLIAVLAGCAVAPYQADPAAARFVSVSSSGGPGPSGRGYFADGHFLVQTSFEIKDGHVHSTQTKSQLSPAQWSALWRAVDALAIERWQPRYTSDGMDITVSDSPRWSVELRRGGASFHSEGDAAGPQVGHPSRRTLSPTVVDELSGIFARFATAPPQT